MKDYMKQFGCAFVMFFTGLCPMGLGVVIVGMTGEKYSSIIMDLSVFVGAVLCILIMKKQFSISVKKVFKKPKVNLLVLSVVSAMIYTLITAFTEYRSVLSKPSDERYSLTEWIASAFLAPVSEEIIFRFSMLTLLLMSAGRSKKIVSFVLVSAMWAVIHFGGTLSRFIDIFIVGIILSTIFTESGNIIYCMIFHSVANVSIYVISCNSTFLLHKDWLLYLSISLLLVCIGLFIYISEKTKLTIKD